MVIYMWRVQNEKCQAFAINLNSVDAALLMALEQGKGQGGVASAFLTGGKGEAPISISHTSFIRASNR